MLSNTKMKFIALNFALIFCFNFSFAQNHPTHFKSEMAFGSGIVFSTFLDVAINHDEFTITSPENADVRIMGAKAKLGRLLGKSPKNGIILTISGTQKADSLFGETKISMVGKLKFRGAIKNNRLNGEFLNSDTAAIGSLNGVHTTEDKINYAPLYPKLIKTIQDNIYSTSVLQTREWNEFKRGIEKLCKEAHDDIELYFGFNMLTPKLPFTHLSLAIAQDVSEPGEPVSTQQSVIFKEESSSTAYLQIKNFASSTDELAAVLPGIVANTGYKNLIIDLRNNGGGGIEAAFMLAKYIVSEDMEVGYFPTNKLSYTGYQPELFKTLPTVQPVSTEEFGNELKTTPGAKLIFKKPNNPVFKGNIYVLTNGKTASTCEPMVYALKQGKKATIIGEKTYGGMLAATPFAVSGKYKLMIPIADFYTYDGIRLDKVGVMPNIEIKEEEALNKALEIINGH